jgi:peptidoglycan/xylan/chitin deacetylase (PgdA/CDA1 family)
MSYPSRIRFPLRTNVERLTAAARLIRMVKDERELDLERFLDEVSEACGASIGEDEERKMAEALLLTWDDVRALRDAGMGVQSHTRSHRTLQTVPLARLRDELGGSREVLERELGERVRAVAYPVGKRLGSAPQIRGAVHAAGYELGFSNDSGVNNVWTFDALDVRRLSLDMNLPEAEFLAMLAVPWLAY